MNKIERIPEYEVLRLAAILLVVAGHSDFIFSHGFSVSDYISEDLFTYRLEYATLRPWIYGFHMPLFMLLSGGLFAKTAFVYEFGLYIRRRAKRLLVPLVVCGVLFSVPIKYIVGYYGEANLLYSYTISLVTLRWPGHLWYLWVTFIINVVFYRLLSNLEKGRPRKIAILAACLVLHILSSCGIEWFQFYRLLEFPLYFYLGFLFEREGYREKVTEFIKSGKERNYFLSIGLFLLYSLMIIANRYIELPSLLNQLRNFIEALIGSSMMFYICATLTYNIGIPQKPSLLVLQERNFSIYLYHEPLQFLILFVMEKTGGGLLACFNSNYMFIVLYILRFTVSIFLSVCIGKLVDELILALGKILRINA